MNQNNSKYNWHYLFKAVSRRAYLLIEYHNLQYPCKHELKKWKEKFPGEDPPNLYSLAYPKRVKESEEKTFINILKQWCKQVDNQIKKGSTTISNRVFTNRKSARNFKRSARGTNQHLAKGVYAGLLLGQEETEILEYTCQFNTEQGKGLGVKPWKQWHGSNRDFEICIHPYLIPIDLLPEGVDFKSYNPFENEPSKTFEASVWKMLPSKEKKMQLSPKKIETYNKTISPQSIDGNSEAVGRIGFAQKYLEGKILDAYVELLMSAYLDRLGKAMKRSFHPREIENGKKSILQMLQNCPATELDGFVERCLATIKHMEQWIYLDPESNFVMPPSYWFDLSYPHNIAGAHKGFYLPWKQLGESFKTIKRKRDPSISNLSPNNFTFLTGFAESLKRHFSHFHPNDKTLAKAKLQIWQEELRRQVELDKASINEIRQVATWLFKSDSKRAKFWREECGGLGIRSASGFRRHFVAMKNQMLHERFAGRQKECFNPKA